MGPDQLLAFVHTPLFDESITEVPMTDDDLRRMQSELHANPDAGDLVQGTGGARKIRVGVKGRGKRGGARVIYFARLSAGKIYLLLAYGKGYSDDLSASGKATLRTMLKEIR